MKQKISQILLDTIKNEAKAIGNLTSIINDDFISAIITIHETKGKTIVTGLGKSALIARKLVATLNSTGTASIFLHAADALHGDVGMVESNDIVIVISKSGSTPELKILLPLLQANHNKIISITNTDGSFLTKHCDFNLIAEIEKEACPINLAPTTSSTVQMVLGDAIANALMMLKGFSSDDFLKVHPAGSLGKKLYLKVKDITPENSRNFVDVNDSIEEVIVKITSGMVGAVAVTDSSTKLCGIITDGDLRRMLKTESNYHNLKAGDIMTKEPKKVESDKLAIEAFQLLKKHKISQLLVTEDDQLLGIIHLHVILKEGIV